MRTVSVLNPLLEGPYVFYANCKKCGEPHQMQVFKTGVTIGIKLIQHNRKYTAICTNCKTVYNVDKEVGDNLLKGKGTLILKEK